LHDRASTSVPHPRSSTERWLWIAIAMGPLAWIVDLVLAAWLSDGAKRHTTLELAIGASALVVAFAATTVGRSVAGRVDEPPPRERALAQASIVLGTVSALLVVATAMPAVVLASGIGP
jgi:small-conductance mechanosensitive channel